MQVYVDITLLPGDDIGQQFLWEKLYKQVHIAFVENKNAEEYSPFGISFPEFHSDKYRLGRKLRVFAHSQGEMEVLDLSHWLKRLTDYVHITSIRPVPEKIEGYVRFQRLQLKSSPERLARRAAKRHDIPLEQAREQRSNVQPQYSRAPYIWMSSVSNGERFRLLITRDQVNKEVIEEGKPVFSTYGLAVAGKANALPHF